MSENKTKVNDNDVRMFLAQVEHEKRREDAFKILELMEEITGMAPVMWGDNMIGFGNYHYRYESGREGDMFLVGFSPRKQNMALYITAGFDEYDELLNRMGKTKTGKSCMYINKTEDIDLEVFRELVRLSVQNHPGIRDHKQVQDKA